MGSIQQQQQQNLNEFSIQPKGIDRNGFLFTNLYFQYLDWPSSLFSNSLKTKFKLKIRVKRPSRLDMFVVCVCAVFFLHINGRLNAKLFFLCYICVMVYVMFFTGCLRIRNHCSYNRSCNTCSIMWMCYCKHICYVLRKIVGFCVKLMRFM